MHVGRYGSRQCLISLALLWGLTLPGSDTFALEYGAEVGLGQIYTNNLFLLPDDQAESEWITAIVPRIYVEQIRPKYEVEFDYTGEALFYSNRSEFNEAYSDMFARGILDVLSERLFVTGLARYTQVNISPEGQLPDNNVNVTGNRSDAFAWEAGPRWAQGLFANSEVDAHYYVGSIQYDDPELQGATTQRAQFRLRTLAPRAKTLTYDTYYRYQRLDYGSRGVNKFQRLYLQVGYMVTDAFQPVFLVGAENNIASTNGLLDEPYWEAGFQSLIKDNRLEAYYGRRFYGPTYRVRWTRMTHRSNLWVDYRETQHTTESGALDDLVTDIDAEVDPSSGQSLTPPPGTDRPGTGLQLLRKRARVEWRLNRYRGSTRIYGFWVDDEQVITSNILPLPSVESFVDKSFGAGIGLSWEMGNRTALTFFGEWTRRKLAAEQQGTSDTTNDVYRTNARLRYQISRTVEICGLVGFQSQTGGTVEWDELNAAIRLKWNFLGSGAFGGRQTGYAPLDCSRVY